MPRWTNNNIYSTQLFDIPMYDGYKLTEEFKIIGKTGKILSETESCDSGHRFVNVYVNKRSEILYIHRAVALVHVDGYSIGAVVDHIDDNSKNNNPNNLRWITSQQNNYNVKGRFNSTDCDMLVKIQNRILSYEDKIHKLRMQEQLLINILTSK